jgi:hypothetical protein
LSTRIVTVTHGLIHVLQSLTYSLPSTFQTSMSIAALLSLNFDSNGGIQ